MAFLIKRFIVSELEDRSELFSIVYYSPLKKLKAFFYEIHPLSFMIASTACSISFIEIPSIRKPSGSSYIEIKL
jgi:hypothetical protein